MLLSLSATFLALAQQPDRLAELNRDLTGGARNDSMKVVSVYEWIVSNISYDYHFFQRNSGDTILTQEPEIVVRRKQAVCIGYCKLFKALCRLNHIPAETIIGFVKINGAMETREEHAWNAVKINKTWYLADLTWDASQTLPYKYYFLAGPKTFVQNHLPHDPLWQLSEHPVPFECFANIGHCRQSDTIYFNIKDSLARFEALDSVDRALAAANRVYHYNSEDYDALRDLGDYYFQRARAAYNDYAALREQAPTRKALIPLKTDLLTLLNSATDNFQSSKKFYARLAELTKSRKKYTDGQFNLDVIVRNLENIAEEKAMLESI